MLPLWLGLQMIALVLAAGRVPLYARFPVPIERQATVEMLAIQLIAAGLLFPRLLRGKTAWLWTIAATWPMLTLAGLLAGDPMQRVAAAAAYVALWLTTLAVFAPQLKTPPQRMIAVALASLWTIGGPILLYLHSEFAGVGNLWPPNHSNIPYALAGGPIWAALFHLRARHLALFSDIPMVMLLIGGVVFGQVRNRRPGQIA
jgi:hypothetical protein